jgi:DNA primase
MPKQTRKQQLLELVDPLDYIQERTPMQKHMGGMIGVCPIHKGASPSMLYARDTREFNCVLCGSNGDLIDFIKALDMVDEETALETLEVWNKANLQKKLNYVKSGQAESDFVEQKRDHAARTSKRKK